jgi:hypothetical protein
MLGAGITLLNAQILPRWMAWTAVVIGVLSLLGPGGFLGFFLGFFLSPLWMVVAGIMLARRSAFAAPERSGQSLERRVSQST